MDRYLINSPGPRRLGGFRFVSWFPFVSRLPLARITFLDISPLGANLLHSGWLVAYPVVLRAICALILAFQKIIEKLTPQKNTLGGKFCDFQEFFGCFSMIFRQFWNPPESFFRLFWPVQISVVFFRRFCKKINKTWKKKKVCFSWQNTVFYEGCHVRKNKRTAWKNRQTSHWFFIVIQPKINQKIEHDDICSKNR